MTAFAINSGGIEYYDQKTGGSVNATLDTYTVSNGSTLVVRTDTYACPNHSSAFGSLDNVAFSGIGGEVIIDPTYVRYVAYTGGSGNSPAFGAAISQGGVSGVFLGVWANWQSEPIVPGAAIPASGFIKIGGVTGGAFSAGALTGITATCSGADLQGWIEVRSAETATINVPRVGEFTSVEAWFYLDDTTGVAGQVIQCPTTASFAGVFPACQFETSPGSGVFEWYSGVGSQVSVSTTRTDESCKFLWSTTSGLRLGNNGTNNVGYLPPAGCRVRIPAVILTNCTRSAAGSGVRVLPHATTTTRCEFVTLASGSIDLRGVVCQWFLNMSQAYSVSLVNCAINDTITITEILSSFTVDSCVCTPTQAQGQTPFWILSCVGGGVVTNSKFWRFSMASGGYVSLLNYSKDVIFNGCTFGCLTLRTSVISGAMTSTQSSDCEFNSCTLIGGRLFMNGARGCKFNDTIYFDSTNSTTTTSSVPTSVINLSAGCDSNLIDGIIYPNPQYGAYESLISMAASYKTVIQNIGTFDAPFQMGSTVTGYGLLASGDNDDIKYRRVYLAGTRLGPYSFQNSDNNVVIENSAGDDADAVVVASLNTIVKNVRCVGSTSGQTSVYGSHWQYHFASNTSGFFEITCNEPTVESTAQCYIAMGSPKFNSVGSVLMTVVGQQIIWEMPEYALGHTALANSDLALTGTNTGNLSYEFQYDIGAGYNGAWLTANATNFTGVGAIDPAGGIKIKLRVTCVTANASNALTNIRIATVTTATAQSENLYPLDTITLTFTGLITGSDVVVRAAGTSTILASVDSNAGTTWSYVYETPVAIDVDVIKPGYVPKSLLRNYTPSAQNSSLPVSQLLDRNYL